MTVLSFKDPPFQNSRQRLQSLLQSNLLIRDNMSRLNLLFGRRALRDTVKLFLVALLFLIVAGLARVSVSATGPVHIATDYPDTTEQPGTERENRDLQRYMHHHRDQAKFFIDCIYRRWRTLKRVAQLIVDYQHEFLEKGIRFMRHLTR